MRDVGRLARPPQRRALDHPLVHLRVPEVEGLRADDPGHDGVRRDAVPCALERERLRQADQARPSSSSSSPGRSRRACPATEAMFTIRPHSRSTMCGQTAREQLNAPVRLTRRSRSQSSGAWSPSCPTWSSVAGVVDEDVDRAELLDHPRHGRLDLLAIRHVALDRGRAAAELLDLLRRLLGVDEALRPRHLRQRAVLGCVLRLVRLDLDVGDDDVGAGAARARARPAARARASRR